MLETTDYTIFKSIRGNRPIVETHVNKLIKAIETKNLLESFPVLVNEDYEVVDGQHRVEAAKRLGLPIPYQVVSGLKLQNVMDINTNSKNWSMEDFVDAHIQLGNQNYVALRTFQKHSGVSLAIAARLLFGGFGLFNPTGVVGGSSATRAVKTGAFTVKNMTQAERIVNKLSEIQHHANFNVKSDRSFIEAITRLDKNPSFDHKRFIAKMQMNNLKLETKDSTKYYILRIEEMYNYQSSKPVELYQSTLNNKR